DGYDPMMPEMKLGGAGGAGLDGEPKSFPFPPMPQGGGGGGHSGGAGEMRVGGGGAYGGAGGFIGMMHGEGRGGGIGHSVKRNGVEVVSMGTAEFSAGAPGRTGFEPTGGDAGSARLSYTSAVCRHDDPGLGGKVF